MWLVSMYDAFLMSNLLVFLIDSLIARTIFFLIRKKTSSKDNIDRWHLCIPLILHDVLSCWGLFPMMVAVNMLCISPTHHLTHYMYNLLTVVGALKNSLTVSL